MQLIFRSETAQRLRFCVSFAELLDSLHRGQLVLQGQGGELEHAELLLSKMVTILRTLMIPRPYLKYANSPQPQRYKEQNVFLFRLSLTALGD